MPSVATRATADARPLIAMDEATHVYTHADGHQPPSVTTILGSVPPWLGRFDRANQDRLEYRRQIGTMVHKATHYLDEGDLDEASVDPAIVPYLDAWKRFKDEKRFQPLVMETLVYHAAYGYAGTLDRIGVADCAGSTEPVLLDIKTGDGSMAGPQTAAYLEAWTSMQGPSSCAPVSRRWTVQIHDTGRYTITEHTSRRDLRVFLAALELFTYARSHTS